MVARLIAKGEATSVAQLCQRVNCPPTVIRGCLRDPRLEGLVASMRLQPRTARSVEHRLEQTAHEALTVLAALMRTGEDAQVQVMAAARLLKVYQRAAAAGWLPPAPSAPLSREVLELLSTTQEPQP